MAVTHLFTNFRYKKAKRAGRGIAANLGKTAGRGTKGQKSRAGAGRKIKTWFEGGQTPLFRKLAKKRGFATYNQAKRLTITTDTINHFFHDGETVSPQTLLEKGVIRAAELKLNIKIVKRSPLKVKLTFTGVGLTKSLSDNQSA